MNKRTLRGAVLVEGKYDCVKLANLVQGLILTTEGFEIYSNAQKRNLLRTIAREQGLTILTDSDRAGFQIRHYVTNFCGEANVRQAFIPARRGKEHRKEQPGKEGLLGVEGMPDYEILCALENAGALEPEEETPTIQSGSMKPIEYYDLYEWGLSGGADSRKRRQQFIKKLDLPPRISKKMLLTILNTLYTRTQIEEIVDRLNEAPAIE